MGRKGSVQRDHAAENYVPTVFENYTASFEIEKQRIELNMWDTSDIRKISSALAQAANSRCGAVIMMRCGINIAEAGWGGGEEG
ncbi:Rho-related GTP-binding protein RhoN, partial [Ophiophagus hannah]